LRQLVKTISVALLLALPSSCLDWSGGQGDWFLCEPCQTSDECGGPKDYCYENKEGQKFCVKDCSGGQACPDDWACYTVIRNAYSGKLCLPRDKRCP
jgi:hypothetical protein